MKIVSGGFKKFALQIGNPTSCNRLNLLKAQGWVEVSRRPSKQAGLYIVKIKRQVVVEI